MVAITGSGAPTIINAKPMVLTKLVPPPEEGPGIEVVGGAPVAVDGVYVPPEPVEVVLAESQDAPGYLTDQLLQQAVRHQPKLALQDLSLNLAAFLEDDETGVSQTVTRYRHSSMAAEPSPLDVVNFKVDRRNVDNELKLQVKTKDGDTLTFTFRHETGYGHTDTRSGIGYQNLTVSFELDGELSEQEKEELTGLAEGLNALANGYFNGEGAKLSDLQLDRLDSVAELSLSLGGAGPRDISLSMTDNDVVREYRIQMNGDTIKMSRDKLSLIGSTDPERREAVLDHYRKMLIEGVERSHGGTGRHALVVDAFNLLHGADSKEGSAVELTDAESTMLTGLADFSFNFEGRVTRRTFNPQLGELAEQMSFSLSQETRIKTDGPLAREVDQRQKWTLKSSYFEPLPYLESVDFDQQNYRYVTLKEQAEVRTRVGLVDGSVRAVQTQQFDSERNEIWVVRGEVADWKTTKHSLYEIHDFTARLRIEDDNFDAVLLEEILLDPQAMAERAAVHTVDRDLSSAP